MIIRARAINTIPKAAGPTLGVDVSVENDSVFELKNDLARSCRVALILFYPFY
jgi:hypothetical protein